jgi:hypothetical protein
MSEIGTVTTLRAKRDEIRATIRMYEKKLEQAKSDLAHVTAAARLFEISGKPQDIARYVDSYRLFERGEPWAICAPRGSTAPSPRKNLRAPRTMTVFGA